MKTVLSLAALLTAVPAFAVTANSGLVAAAGRVQLQTGVDVNPVDTDSAVGLPSSLSASAVATTPGTDGLGITASSRVDAVWTSAKAGSATMIWGWDTLSNEDYSVDTKVPLTQTNWSYTFTTGNAPGTFNADWQMDVSGNTFGIQYVEGFYNQGGFYITPDVDGSGSLSIPLGANGTYTIGFGNPSGVGASQPLTTSATFRFDWTITGGGDTGGVPEPASWAMLITGFGLVGGSLRQRRKALA